MEIERIKFMKIFANLPEKIRREDIIVVIDKKPYTWNAACLEVENNTELGKKILKKLKELNIIWEKKIKKKRKNYFEWKNLF